jgi:membrane-associated protease RseP (regulator of RpoE activity)
LEQEESKEGKIRVERKFILILIHTPFGLHFFDWAANTALARLYAKFNIYLMPVITALAIILISYGLISMLSNPGIRAGEREQGIPHTIQSLLLIPGLNPYLPWTYGWIALVITIVIHEVGHGIIARVHKIKVDSTGILLLLGLPVGAFVNIAQEELARTPLKQKSAILTAGPVSNMIVTAISFIALYLLLSTLTPIPSNSIPQYGVMVLTVEDHTLAGSIGLSKGSVVQTAAGHKVISTGDLGVALRSNLGKTIDITWIDKAGHQVIRSVSLPKHAEPNHGILGVTLVPLANPEQVLNTYKGAFALKNPILLLYPPTIAQPLVPYSDLMAPNYHSSVLGSAFAPVANMLFWIMFINFNVGIFNALPIGPFDGGQFYNYLIEHGVISRTRKLKNVSFMVTIAMAAVVIVSVFGAWIIR